MTIVSSYDVQIIGLNKIFEPTLKICREALAYLIDIFDKEWENIHAVTDAQKRFNFAEHLIHGTKKNPAKYAEFDVRFHKMPCYFRRSVAKKALGCVSSYRSNLKNWEKNGKKGDKPTLTFDRYETPCFYRDNTFVEGDEPDTILLKLFIGNDWVWKKIKLRHTDMEYLRRRWSMEKASAPVLEKRHKKYYLRFAFEENVELNNIVLERRTTHHRNDVHLQCSCTQSTHYFFVSDS